MKFFMTLLTSHSNHISQQKCGEKISIERPFSCALFFRAVTQYCAHKESEMLQ
jgi:hypothetical protein